MAKNKSTLTLRLEKDEVKLIDDIKKLTHESTASRAIISGMIKLIHQTKELEQLEAEHQNISQDHEEVMRQLDNFREALKAFTTFKAPKTRSGRR